MESNAQQPLLHPPGSDEGTDVEKGASQDLSIPKDSDAAAPLRDEEPAAPICGSGNVNRLVESDGDLLQPEPEVSWIRLGVGHRRRRGEPDDGHEAPELGSHQITALE
jgi:hypothetical protein